jgi:hypothetical protein
MWHLDLHDRRFHGHAGGLLTDISIGCQCGNWTCMAVGFHGHAGGLLTDISTGAPVANVAFGLAWPSVFMATQVDLTDISTGCQCGNWTCMSVVFMATQVDF